MAVSLAERLYAAGAYGPFSIDGFVKEDTDWLEASFTVVDWPTNSALITGQFRWNTGDGENFTIPSPPKNRNGTLKTVYTHRFLVPQRPDGKAAVTSGTVTITVAQALRTAFSFTNGSNAA